MLHTHIAQSTGRRHAARVRDYTYFTRHQPHTGRQHTQTSQVYTTVSRSSPNRVRSHVLVCRQVLTSSGTFSSMKFLLWSLGVVGETLDESVSSSLKSLLVSTLVNETETNIHQLSICRKPSLHLATSSCKGYILCIIINHQSLLQMRKSDLYQINGKMTTGFMQLNQPFESEINSHTTTAQCIVELITRIATHPCCHDPISLLHRP